MAEVEQRLSRTKREALAGLRELDANEVARYAADTARPWYERRTCALALAGRVPEEWVAGLATRVRDPGETSELRIALLEALAGRTELLPWLRHEDRRRERSEEVRHAVLKARGLLGDRSAARELSTLASDPWQRRRAAGEAGLEGLVAHHGVEPVLAALGDSRPEDRAFAVLVRHRAGADVTASLADPDRTSHTSPSRC